MVSASRQAIGEENRIPESVLARLICLPRAVGLVLDALRTGGARGWLCGGCVRDLLLGVIPGDVDLAMDCAPEVAMRLLPAAWILDDQSGLSLGSLRLEVEGCLIEITSLREDGPYSDGRKPDSVRFVEDPRVDYRRRDFTVNAMYLDPLEGTLLDPSGGLDDVETRRLRTVGDACSRFEEDSLRLLRAIRFSAQCGLVMDAATWSAVLATANRSAMLSRSRVRDELEGIFRSRGRARGLMLLVESGLADIHLPRIPPLREVPQPPQYHPEGDVLRHTALVLAFLPDPVPVDMAWAAVFHDIGKKDTFEIAADRIRFHDHDRVSAVFAESWLLEHGVPRSVTERVASLVREHIRFAALPGFRASKRRAFLQDPLFEKHLEFHRADCMASHRMLDIYASMRRERAQLPPGPPSPLLMGRDLVGIGFRPGPAIGTLLARIEQERAEGHLGNRQEALEFALRWRDDHSA
mgnify:CR=1 FL=1